MWSSRCLWLLLPAILLTGLWLNAGPVDGGPVLAKLPVNQSGATGKVKPPAVTGQVSRNIAQASGPSSGAPNDLGASADAQDDTPLEARLGELERQEALRRQWQSSLQQHQKFPGHLQQWLERWLSACEPSQCLASLHRLLADYPDAAFARRVEALAAAFPEYKNELGSLTQDTRLPAMDRYARVDALRAQHFDDGSSEWLFGEERRFAHYRFAVGELMDISHGNLEFSERLNRVDALYETWQQNAGPFTPSVSPVARYRQAMTLLDQTSLAGAQKEAARSEARHRYLDEESAQRVLQREARQARQQDQVAAYWEAVAALNQDMQGLRSQLSAQAWEAEQARRLEALRLSHFSDAER